MELLDTDVLIDVQRGHAPAIAWFAQLGQLPSVPGFVVMELVQDARNNKEVQAALQLAAPFAIVWPSDADSHQAIQFFATFHLSHGLGLLDALIAASAVGRSAALLTFNRKHYHMIPGLQIVEPYVR